VIVFFEIVARDRQHNLRICRRHGDVHDAPATERARYVELA
jgi:hypothetical protein